MQTLKQVFISVTVAMSLGIATTAYAEAPVYEADALQQQFENAGAGDDQQDNLPMPPAPAQEGAFIPTQEQSQPPQAPPRAPRITREHLPALASRDPSYSVEDRMRRMEQMVNTLQGTDVVARMESLQTQMQALHNQVEQLTHQLQLLQNQQKSLYTELDKKFSQQLANLSKPEVPARPVAPLSVNEEAPISDKPDALKTAGNTKANVPPVTQANGAPIAKPIQPNVAEEQQIYQLAYNLIKAKKYNDAVNVLQGMLQKYPSGQFAANAHYWLGELYGLMNKNDNALLEFKTIVRSYPESPRVSDAQLKVGLIYASQFRWRDAKSAFRRVVNRFPGTASARLAADQLKQIRQSGH